MITFEDRVSMDALQVTRITLKEDPSFGKLIEADFAIFDRSTTARGCSGNMKGGWSREVIDKAAELLAAVEDDLHQLYSGGKDKQDGGAADSGNGVLGGIAGGLGAGLGGGTSSPQQL